MGGGGGGGRQRVCWSPSQIIGAPAPPTLPTPMAGVLINNGVSWSHNTTYTNAQSGQCRKFNSRKFRY